MGDLLARLRAWWRSLDTVPWPAHAEPDGPLPGWERVSDRGGMTDCWRLTSPSYELVVGRSGTSWCWSASHIAPLRVVANHVSRSRRDAMRAAHRAAAADIVRVSRG